MVLTFYLASMNPKEMIEEPNFSSNIVDALKTVDVGDD